MSWQPRFTTSEHGPDAAIIALEVRNAGIFGLVWLPTAEAEDLRRDIDGLTVTAQSSQGHSHAGHLIGLARWNDGVELRFVLEPSLPYGAAWLTVSFQPYSLADHPEPVELTASVGLP